MDWIVRIELDKYLCLNLNMTEDIKTTLWKSADKLRAQMDAAEYKHIVLGLIFLKSISDKFGAQQEKIRQMVLTLLQIISSVKILMTINLS